MTVTTSYRSSTEMTRHTADGFSLPKDWKLAKLKWKASIASGKSEKAVSGKYPLYGANGIIGQTESIEFQQKRVLIGRVGSAGAINLGVGQYGVSDNALVVDSDDSIDIDYLHYVMSTLDFTIDISVNAQPLITGSAVKEKKIPFPTSKEQRTIAAFLDYETARIDRLMAKQKRLIELLKEKRQAVISHAVTKGLNPDAPMKDSGVEWLGQVPEHWDVSQLKYAIKAGTSITYGIVQAGPHIEDGIPYIKTSDMSGDHLPIAGYSKTSAEIDQSYRRSKVEEGDIVVAIRATVGKCLPVPQQLAGANLTQGTAKVSPGPRLISRYVLSYMSSSYVQTLLTSQAKGATFKEITLDMLRRTPVLVPPLNEQTEIARYVDIAVGRFDRLINATKQQQALLVERRTALISAAVTGKIDVRNWTPAGQPAEPAQLMAAEPSAEYQVS